ncbi:MAG: twin-arginine translocase subunit TatB [Candidatus Dactylopiibacterium carminicum]|uniref:Sec-independent protein translocase protein TatB n=1 Tax=Candidatus Dactylopiibacterium carminicum TaxID=857335 RepID=A0A272EV12_9RHOO|nr:Sec-independent protein translocase protein TatB [Candidatus Dactylopiibacterium carminicum]KAF7599838.1 twin-arginine translocase subunit TatB [Candidatus Dactylopiibacterium carminicum]PAS93949.1 MAG: twin-arginine translocase subunit TatB [Candidatus Dactylopiibacterium carminicum]PAS97264.1 MAG: twin-arginine translocase subunit TatB [Candidatus Dactylopiibacterium carminicum]PAS99838.1 MAG: twin arginine-targeting protein translocase TatB [Candidatus Dactylopiibacterium carminicum]
MFDIGFSEILVIGIVALVVFGPEELPRVARTAGHWLGKLRRYVSAVKADIDREIEAAELKTLVDDVQSSARKLQASLTEQASAFEAELSREVTPVAAEARALEQEIQQSLRIDEAAPQVIAETSVQDVPVVPDTPPDEVQAESDDKQLDLFAAPGELRKE